MAMGRVRMIRVAAAATAALGLPGARAAPADGADFTAPAATQEATPAAASLDPSSFFQQLIDRYVALESYQDSADATYLTERPGEEPLRVETRIACEVKDGALRVETPGSQLREALGLDLPVGKTPALEALVLRYKLWLAPHMALRFTDDPRRELRQGVEEGFTPTRVEQVAQGARQLMHLELRSGDGLSEECAARFDLFVNPETMLIERIEGVERLPDGTQYRTFLEISPIRAEGAPAPPPPPAA